VRKSEREASFLGAFSLLFSSIFHPRFTSEKAVVYHLIKYRESAVFMSSSKAGKYSRITQSGKAW
jgi:hypothetical protein